MKETEDGYLFFFYVAGVFALAGRLHTDTVRLQFGGELVAATEPRLGPCTEAK